MGPWWSISSQVERSLRPPGPTRLRGPVQPGSLYRPHHLQSPLSSPPGPFLPYTRDPREMRSSGEGPTYSVLGRPGSWLLPGCPRVLLRAGRRCLPPAPPPHWPCPPVGKQKGPVLFETQGQWQSRQVSRMSQRTRCFGKGERAHAGQGQQQGSLMFSKSAPWPAGPGRALLPWQRVVRITWIPSGPWPLLHQPRK